MEALLLYEYHRLATRGLFLIPATFFFALYILFLPPVLTILLNWLLLYFSEFFVKILTVLIVHHVAYIIQCLVFFLIPLLKSNLFERYRLGKQWPSHLWKKALITESINFFIIIPVVQSLFLETGIIQVKLNEYVPTSTEVFCQIYFA